MKQDMKKAGLIFLIYVAIILIPTARVLAGGPGDDFGNVESQAPSLAVHDRENGELSLEEQIRLSSKEFIKIYELSQGKDRSANLEQIINLYYLIINQYPDAPLAEESYWHLIGIMLNDFQPAKKSEALELYNAFINNYPDSLLKNVIADTLMRFYYRNKLWDDLRIMTAPYITEIKSIAALETPVPIFLYAEATFHLAGLQEASRWYELIINFFPDSLMARIAKVRMRDSKQIDE